MLAERAPCSPDSLALLPGTEAQPVLRSTNPLPTTTTHAAAFSATRVCSQLRSPSPEYRVFGPVPNVANVAMQGDTPQGPAELPGPPHQDHHQHFLHRQRLSTSSSGMPGLAGPGDLLAAAAAASMGVDGSDEGSGDDLDDDPDSPGGQSSRKRKRPVSVSYVCQHILSMPCLHYPTTWASFLTTYPLPRCFRSIYRLKLTCLICLDVSAASNAR